MALDEQRVKVRTFGLAVKPCLIVYPRTSSHSSLSATIMSLLLSPRQSRRKERDLTESCVIPQLPTLATTLVV